MTGSSFLSIARAVCWRSLHNAVANPALILPALIFPLFFLLAFAGGLSSIGDVPGFDFPSGYTAFQFVWVVLQSAAFTGVFLGFNMAADFEGGFVRRLMLAAPHRAGIVAGYVAAALVRGLFTSLMLFVIALVAGMDVGGTPLQLLGLLGLALLLSLVAALWGTGMAMRFRSLQAAPLMQTPVFVALFLAPVWVPFDLLEGWIRTAASANPITSIIEAGRGFISGEPTEVLLAFGLAIAMVALAVLWSGAGLRRAERAG